ncbi:MAG: NUDIX domain-containing protein [Caldilineaceae bacterium]|nr:NUDIX domain-containing protein [Caldilineaceae bacterium]
MSIDRQSLPAISANTKRTWQRMRHDHSAGGVAYRYIGDEGELEVALIATKGMSRWQLPKGSCEIGESTEETAIREVEEEAGLSTRREAFLKTIEYWYWDTYRKEVPELVHKEVDFYLLRVVGGQINDECCEVDAVGWFAPQQALGMLTYDGERAALELALAKLDSQR